MLSCYSSLRRCFIALLIFTFCAAAPGMAATWTVTSPGDDGSAGTLRYAIANAASGDTINFNLSYPATITLSSTISIGTNLTITGPGSANLSISGGNAVQVFNVSGAITVNISDVTIENGKTLDYGAGIENSGATLKLTDDVFSGSVAGSVNSSNYPVGGGAALANTNNGTVVISSCTFSGNEAIQGGALNNASGIVTITDSTVTGNTSSSYGGGVLNSGTMTITNSTISANNNAYPGGGAYNFGSMAISDSTFSGNSAGYDGGGVANNGTLTVVNSTFFGNNANNGPGGGISNGDNGSGTAEVSFTTFAANQTGSSAYTGGAVASLAGSVVLKGTILANSYTYPKPTPNADCYVGPSSYAVPPGTISSSGYNLSDDSSCASFLTAAGDMNITSAGLDPNGLQNNGGPTQTVALLSNSPALDAIPDSACTDLNGSAVITDQRGAVRPQGAGCEVGAFELVPPDIAAILPPIQSDGSSVFNAARGVVPVKFSLSVNGAATCNLPPATVSLERTAGGTVGTVDESVFEMSADTGSDFRIDSTACQYVYNLDAASLGAGTYIVKININGVAVGSGTFGLR